MNGQMVLDLEWCKGDITKKQHTVINQQPPDDQSSSSSVLST